MGFLNDIGLGGLEDIVDVLDPITGLANNLWDEFTDLVGDFLELFIDIPNPEDYLIDGILLNKQSNTSFLPVVYGEQRLGGTIVFLTTTGTNNDYLHVVLALCEGEIESIDTVYLDDVDSTDSRFSGLVTVTKYTGTDTQAADSTLVSEVTDWTTSHQLLGVAYVYVKLQWDKDAFTRLPTINCDVKGRKVKDIRTSPHTTAYSNNPALCIRDYLTNDRYGKGLAETLIDDTAISDAADECETQIQDNTASPSAQINKFACDGVLNTQNQIFDNIKALLSSCMGWLPVVAGQYTLVLDKAETIASPDTTFTFDEDNIIGGWSFGMKGKRDRYNRVTMKFRNPDRSWQSDVVVEDNPTLRVEDNNTLLETEVTLPFDTSPYRAQYKAEVALKQSRENIYCSFSATTEAWNVSVGQVVYVTHTTPGWTKKLFRVISLNLMSNGLVSVKLKEYAATVYDRTIPAEHNTAPDTNLPNPYSVAAPTNLALTSGTSTLYIRSDGTIGTRAKITWTPSTDIFVSEYVIEFKESSSSTWIPAGLAKGLNTGEAIINDVNDGTNYDVRVKAVNSLGIDSSYITITNQTVVGKTEPPPDCDNFLVQRQADGTREFSGGLLTANIPLDFAGYKIKAKSGTGLAWSDLTSLHEGVITSLPWETNQLAAGTYTAGIKAVDTTGNESTNAKIIESTLGDPRIKNVLDTFDPKAQGWPGTLTDCWVAPNGNIYATDSKDWASFSGDSPVTTWAGWTEWARSPNSPIIYQYATADSPSVDYIDAGTITSFTPIISATGNGTVLIEERHSDGDTSPWTWSSWATAGTLITSRYIQIRVTVTNASALADLTQMNIVLSAELIEETLSDLDTSTISASPTVAGDFRLPVTKTYSVIKRVNLALQNVGAGWTWEVID